MQGITLIRDFNNLIVKLKDDDRAKIFVSYATNLLKKWKEEMIAFEVSSIMFFFHIFFQEETIIAHVKLKSENFRRKIEQVRRRKMLTGTSKDSKILSGLLEHQLSSTTSKISRIKNETQRISAENDEKYIYLAASKSQKHASSLKLNSLEFYRRKKGLII